MTKRASARSFHRWMTLRTYLELCLMNTCFGERICGNINGGGVHAHVLVHSVQRCEGLSPASRCKQRAVARRDLHQLYTAGVEVAAIVDQVSARMPTEGEVGLYDVPFNV